MNHSKKTPNSRDEPVMCLPITRKHLIVLSDTLLLGSCHKSTSFLSTSLVEYTNIMPKLIQLLFSKGSLNSLCERLIVKKPLFRNRSREKRLKCGTLHKSWTENKQQWYLWSDDLNPKFQIWVYHSVCAEEFSKEGWQWVSAAVLDGGGSVTVWGCISASKLMEQEHLKRATPQKARTIVKLWCFMMFLL